MKAPANHMTTQEILALGVMSRRTLGRYTRLRVLHPRRLGHRTLWWPVPELERFLGCGLIKRNEKWEMYEQRAA